tara:strand:+ start:190 stop:945 length:756 start_codon:yes stop_codon:yes gene_type:complete
MKLPLYFISDCHIGMKLDNNEKKRREKLFYIFDKIKKSGGTLIIGGDFFDFWFEFRKKTPVIYKNVFDELYKLKNSGVRIHYIAGNHDYWDFGYLESTFVDSFYKGDLSINMLDSKILVTHGDGLLKNDKGYRALKKVLRNKIFIFFYKLLGEKIGYKFGKRASAYYPHYYQQKKPTNPNQNNDEIKSDILDFANSMWNQNYDVVLVGHYHKMEIVKKGTKLLIFLGDWMMHYSITKFDGEEWTQFSWNEL